MDADAGECGVSVWKRILQGQRVVQGGVRPMEDVKSIVGKAVVVSETVSNSKEAITAKKEVKANSESIKSAPKPAGDKVSIKEVKQNNQETAEINQTISFLNVLADTYSQMGKTASQLENLGRAAEELYNNGSDPSEIRAIEAKSKILSDDIAAKTRTLQSQKLDGFDDDVVAEVQRRVGPLLERIFPPSGDDIETRGLNITANDAKQAIISAIEKSIRAQAAISEMGQKAEALISDISSQRSVVAEVAAENEAASMSQLRDVDAALDLANLSTGSVQNLAAVHGNLRPENVNALLND